MTTIDTGRDDSREQDAERATADVHRVIGEVWRAESAWVVATVARIVRDIGVAEELAQDTLVAALEKWPETGIPANPGAWLTAAAKNRAIDVLRRQDRLHQRIEVLGHEAEQTQPSVEAEVDLEEIQDDLLRLVFTACHPVLAAEARVALTLRLLGGLTTKEIARAFLVSEPTVAQRIVRAKRTLAEAGVPFEVPAGAELAPRLAAVLEVVYLIFNEGYSATAGDDWMRPGLCTDAIRLGRVLAELAPGEPEVHGLLALMEIQQSRAGARVDADGEPVLLLEQDRGRWDAELIRRGRAAIDRAVAQPEPPGPYLVQAQIAACHARAGDAADTDWAEIARRYVELYEITGSPVVRLNQAVAVGMADGPQAGLALVDELRTEKALRNYHLLAGVRGDLLAKLGRAGEAAAEFERAASLTQNEKERALMLRRAGEALAARD